MGWWHLVRSPRPLLTFPEFPQSLLDPRHLDRKTLERHENPKKFEVLVGHMLFLSQWLGSTPIRRFALERGGHISTTIHRDQESLRWSGKSGNGQRAVCQITTQRTLSAPSSLPLIQFSTSDQRRWLRKVEKYAISLSPINSLFESSNLLFWRY